MSTPRTFGPRLARLLARGPLASPHWPAGVPQPAPERRTGLDYDPAWARRYPVRLARAVVLDNLARPLARLVAPTTVRGIEHISRLQGPVIFAANHASHLDTPLLLTVLPPHLRHRCAVAAASDYFFDTTWKATLWSFLLAAIPVDRSRVNRRSVDNAAALLDDGWSLVVFPEGGRSPDGWTREFGRTAAYLARRNGRPVVPVHLGGTREVLGKSPEPPAGPRPPGGSGTEATRAGRLRRSPVTVTFGLPLWPDDHEDTRRLGAQLEEAVAVLAAEADSDFWQARRQPAPALVAAARGPEASPWRRAWARGGQRAPGAPPAPTTPGVPDRTAPAPRPLPGGRRWPGPKGVAGRP